MAACCLQSAATPCGTHTQVGAPPHAEEIRQIRALYYATRPDPVVVTVAGGLKRDARGGTLVHEDIFHRAQ